MNHAYTNLKLKPICTTQYIGPKFQSSRCLHQNLCHGCGYLFLQSPHFLWWQTPLTIKYFMHSIKHNLPQNPSFSLSIYTWTKHNLSPTFGMIKKGYKTNKNTYPSIHKSKLTKFLLNRRWNCEIGEKKKLQTNCYAIYHHITLCSTIRLNKWFHNHFSYIFEISANQFNWLR